MMLRSTVISLLVGLAMCKVIPENIYSDPCTADDPNLNKCIQSKINGLKKYITTGIPELNVPPLDPLEMKNVDVDQKLSNNAWIKAKLYNLKAKGASQIEFGDVKFDPKTLTGEISFMLPLIQAETEYDLTGQFLVAPFQSKGYFKGNFTDIKVVAKGSFEKATKRGKEVLQINKGDFITDIGGGYVKLTSKDPSRQMLADMASNFFNENPKHVLEMVAPFYIRTVTSYAKQLINSILAIIPYNELLAQ